MVCTWKVVLLLALFASPRGAAGQPARTGQLSGTVRDATGGVIAGAVVCITSPQLIGGILELATGAEGVWRAPAVPSGTYEVTVSHAGFRSTRLGPVVVSAGQTLAVEVELELAGIVATEHLEAPGQVVDVSSAAIVTTITGDLLLHLPTSRTISDLLNLVPGVAGDMAYGGTKMSNGIHVDGVDTTEPAEQGPWLLYNQNWLAEVQVVGLGADADHGKSTGVNAYGIVRSGANAYSGLAEYWTTQQGWVADNTGDLSRELQRSFAPPRTASYWSANGHVGGPLKRDRLWFFAGLEHITNDHAPAGYDGPVLQEQDDTRAIAKVTAALSPSWRTEGFLQGGRRRTKHSGIGPLVAPEAASLRRRPQASWSTRALGQIGSSILLDVGYAGYHSPAIAEPPTSRELSGHYDLLTGITSVNALTMDRTDRVRHLVSAGGTWYLGRGPRSHEVKLGVQSEWARERTTFEYVGGSIYWDLGGAPYLRDTFAGSSAVGDTRHSGVFVQDRWHVHERITLLPGLRVDLFRGSTSDASGVLRTSPVSGRLGIAWDLRGTGRTVFRTHVGRYSDPVFAQPVLLTDVALSKVVITEALNPDGQWEEISRRSLGGRGIDSDIEHSHVDQLILGIERQLGRDLTVQTQYIHRTFGSFMGFVYEDAVWTPVERRDPGPDGLAGTADDGKLFTVYDLSNARSASVVYTNPDQASRRYDAWQVVAAGRRSENWHFRASYTWARTRGTTAGGFHTNAGRGDLGQGNGDNPNRLINGQERSPHDPTHEAKLLGVWRLFPSLHVAGVYRYMSGSAWGRTFAASGLTQGAEQILAEPRGTRRVDAINNLDVRVESSLGRGGRRIGILADVFNLMNQGAPDSDWVTPVFTMSGPSLGLPVSWRPPRQLRLSIRLMY